MGDIFVSIVSHRQSHLVENLLSDFEEHTSDIDILVTSNIPESFPITSQAPHVSIVQNTVVKGFGENHNAAFRRSSHSFFCVSNPDIRLHENSFVALREAMNDPTIGLVAPLVIAPSGAREDSARKFPTPLGLFKKAIGVSDGRLAITGDSPVTVDWTAGMFMFFRTEAFRQIGGFDEDFFLYYEDVDICARLWKAGWKVAVSPSTSVIHDAQRSSHRSLKYARLHFASLSRYMLKHVGRLPKV